jgi:hypothetical protein
MAKLPIRDITEAKAIPVGATVRWCDYDSLADLYFVEYRDRVYAALPEELHL